jgi:nucleoside-diphosphate-sugar epimerase
MNIQNKKILLVGGSGFIGHNLALYLKEKNANPYIVDSLSINNLYSLDNGEIKNKNLYSAILNNRIDLLKKKKIELIIKDARDHLAVSKIYKQIDPDIIIHLAAVSHANKSNKDPHTTFDNSLRTLENTLDYAKVNKKHVIYLSSSMVYGNFDGKDVSEETNCKPMGIYGTLKLSGEHIVKAYSSVFDLPYTIIRPSALYGERCVSRRVGQIFIENAIQDLDININGSGDEKLDFTYIDDLVQGIYKSCINENSKNQTFNITFGNSRKLSELADLVKSEFPKVKINYVGKEQFMPERGTLNIDKAKKLIDYSPQYKLDDGYIKYIKWYKNFWKNLKNE